jgi:hypothetical protein
MTWPQALILKTHAFDHHDVFFKLWRLRWIAHALSTSPAELFNANIRRWPSPEWICLRSLASSSSSRMGSASRRDSGLPQAFMDTAVAGLLGADRHERTVDRTGHRNGSRMRTWDTRVGTIELAVPKVRPGTYFPSLLQPRRRAEHALLAVVQEATCTASDPGRSTS